jgi:hypothetical protein
VKISNRAGPTNTHAECATRCGWAMPGCSRHLADEGPHLTDPAARIFIGVVNAVTVVIFSVTQQAMSGDGPVSAFLFEVVTRTESGIDLRCS